MSEKVAASNKGPRIVMWLSLMVLASMLLLFGTSRITENNLDLSTLTNQELQSLSQQITQHLSNTSEQAIFEYDLPNEDKEEIQREEVTKRDTGLAKRGNLLDNTAIRVLIGVGVFAFLNVLAISVHHIVQKVRRSTNLYRSIEHVVSPF